MHQRTPTPTDHDERVPGERDRGALHVARRRDGTLEITGDVDASTSGTLDRALRWHEQTPEGGGRGVPLAIDMREVGFVDSSGLRVLVAASLRAGSRGAQVVLRHPAPEFVRLLEITGLSRQFGVEAERGTPDRGGVNEVERRYGADESPS